MNRTFILLLNVLIIASCGLVYYAADHFPRAYHDTLFIGNVVTNSINHDRLERHGSMNGWPPDMPVRCTILAIAATRTAIQTEYWMVYAAS